MGFIIQLGKTNKRRNSTKVPSLDNSLTVELKRPTSILRPSFIIAVVRGYDIASINYCYVPEFHRYYYITSMTWINSEHVQIDCEVDVLATYRSQILNTKAFIVRSESKFNKAIPDNCYPVLGTSKTNVVKMGIYGFSEDGAYILTVASSERGTNSASGTATTYVIGQSGMSTLASKLYGDNFKYEVDNYSMNPITAILSCMWIPVLPQAISTGTGTIKIGQHNFGSSSIARKLLVPGLIGISPYIPHNSKVIIDNVEKMSYGDYRNFSPYTFYKLYLPGIGLIDIDGADFIGDGTEIPTIRISCQVCPINGDITYELKRNKVTGDDNGLICVASGNIGVSMPVAQQAASDLGGVVGSVGSMLGGIGAVAMYGLGGVGVGAALAGVGAISAGGVGFGVAANATSTTVKGSIGGMALDKDMLTNIYAVTISHDIASDQDTGISVIGIPLGKVERLGDLSGYVLCSNAHVSADCTVEEHTTMTQILNSLETNRGVYIE